VKIRAIASQPAGDRDIFPRHASYSGDEFAAVDVETVGEHKNSGKTGRRERPPDRFSACARAIGGRCRLAGDPQCRRIEIERDGRNLVIGHVVVTNLAAGAATDNVRARKLGAKLVVTGSARQRLATAKEKDEIAVGAFTRWGSPAVVLAPRKLNHAHDGDASFVSRLAKHCSDQP
jgi:hypothetical protein